MIIEEITVKNWRGYREPHTFQFDDGFNLLVGRNEAGKSTLFEVFTRVLFDRYSSKAEEIRKIQPIGSSLAPEATIVLRTNGERYKIRKRFLQSPVAELFTQRGDHWELDHEGDAADNALREIFRGEEFKRASRPEHRGLCQALWYLQGDEPLPEKAWAEGIKEGLSGFICQIAKSPDEDRIIQQVEHEYSKIFTPSKGEVKSGSMLDQLQKEISDIENKLTEFNDDTQTVEGFRLDMEGLFEENRLKNEELKSARNNVAILEQKLEDGKVLEEKKKEREEAFQDAGKVLDKTADDHKAVDRRFKDIDEINEDLRKKQQESDELRTEARLEQKEAEHHRGAWKQIQEQDLQQLEKAVASLQAIEQTKILERTKEDVEVRIKRILEIEKELRKKQDELSTTALPTKNELKEFQKIQRDLEIVNGQVEQAAIRIGFDLQVGNISIKADPEAEDLTEEGEYLVLRPTRFTIGDLGMITIRGGGSSLEELHAKAQNLSGERKSILDCFGATNEQELYDLQQHRSDLEREITGLKKDRKEHTSDESLDDLKERALKTQQEITSKRSEVESAPVDWRNFSADELMEKMKDLKKQKKELSKDIKSEQQKEEAARDAYNEASKKAEKSSQDLLELRTKKTNLENENAKVLRLYGTYTQLQEELEKAAATLEEAKKDLEGVLNEYKTLVEEPKEQYKDALNVVQGLEKQIQSVKDNITDKKARIETIISRNIYSKTADQEALLKVKKRQFERVNRQASAIKLLHEMLQAFKKEQSTALSGPVSSLVNQWLTRLTDGSYYSVQMNDELLPVEVLNPRYHETLPLQSLSYGTHEQVVVLLRLAIGVILSDEERNLVVIDDRLVNADPIRMRRLCQILGEVTTDHCQVLVATCNDTPYAGIQGNVIRVPDDGKIVDCKLN